MKNKRTPDLLLVITIISLSVFGALMIYSAGGPYAEARYNDADYFIKKQILWLSIGFPLMYIISHVELNKIKRLTMPLFILTILLLLVVLVFGLVGNGAKRWISIGPITIQPSEIAKISLILILSLYFSKNEENLRHGTKGRQFAYGTLFPILIILIPIILVMLQKHLSCVIILFSIGIIMIVISGARLEYIYGFFAMGGAGLGALALFTDYTKDRITVWRDPEKYKLTGGWQTLQGLMAIGSGGIFGVGFGNSVMKHCYVSEPANDMIFAILCEELGLIGALFAIFLFLILVYRGIKIGISAKDKFSSMVAIGISAKTAIQVLLNLAVVTNSIPNTGISLPFFSYGGSSIMMIFIEMGILISISRNSKIKN